MPAVTPDVTATLNIQLPPAGTTAPLSVMAEAVTVSVPPQVGKVSEGRVTPGGVSVKPTPVRGTARFRLVMVKVNVEAAAKPTVDGLKDLVRTGGETTVIGAVAGGPFPTLEVTELVVLVNVP